MFIQCRYDVYNPIKTLILMLEALLVTFSVDMTLEIFLRLSSEITGLTMLLLILSLEEVTASLEMYFVT